MKQICYLKVRNSLKNKLQTIIKERGVNMKVKDIIRDLSYYNSEDAVEIYVRSETNNGERTDIEFISGVNGVVTLQGDKRKDQ